MKYEMYFFKDIFFQLFFAHPLRNLEVEKHKVHLVYALIVIFWLQMNVLDSGLMVYNIFVILSILVDKGGLGPA